MRVFLVEVVMLGCLQVTETGAVEESLNPQMVSCPLCVIEMLLEPAD